MTTSLSFYFLACFIHRFVARRINIQPIIHKKPKAQDDRTAWIKMERSTSCVNALSFLLLTQFLCLVSSFAPVVLSHSLHSRMSLSADASTSSAPAGPDLPTISPTSKRLFLVRHGEVINPGGDRPVYYGAMDVSLSSLGQEEAKAAGQYLAQFDLEHVFASPLSRAVFGAEQVRQRQATSADKNLIINDGFMELDRGEWCGKTAEEIGAEAMAQFDACDESITPVGGESYPYLKRRVLKARDDALEKLSPGRAAAIVSHLQVTRSMLSEAKGIPTSEMAKLKIATASVTCIDYDIITGMQTVHFESFKPVVGLKTSNDVAN